MFIAKRCPFWGLVNWSKENFCIFKEKPEDFNNKLLALNDKKITSCIEQACEI